LSNFESRYLAAIELKTLTTMSGILNSASIYFDRRKEIPPYFVAFGS
jgi:hypothetical protein